MCWWSAASDIKISSANGTDYIHAIGVLKQGPDLLGDVIARMLLRVQGKLSDFGIRVHDWID